MDLSRFCSSSPVTSSDELCKAVLKTKSGRLGGCANAPGAALGILGLLGATLGIASHDPSHANPILGAILSVL